MKRNAPAAERNKQPILEVLARVLPLAGGRLLEIGSGTGQHAVHFAAGLPAWRIQPSDVDDQGLESIAAWVAEARAAGLGNLDPPLRLDAQQAEWPAIERAHATFDAIFNANTIHISPWSTALGLLDGAARLLPAQGLLVMYGPYMRGGVHTAPSNVAFDADLRARNPAWGVRDLDVVAAEGRARGLVLEEVVSMPANNLTVVYRRSAAG